MENKQQPKTEKTKREEAPKEEKKEYNLSKPSVTKEEPSVKKEEKKRQNSCY